VSQAATRAQRSFTASTIRANASSVFMALRRARCGCRGHHTRPGGHPGKTKVVRSKSTLFRE
jgi:hypothetical protein